MSGMNKVYLMGGGNKNEINISQTDFGIEGKGIRI